MELRYIFWWVAGADRDKMEQCPSDQKRMGAIGMVIVLTTIVALIAGTSAAMFFTQKDGASSGKIGWSIAFGVLWAVIIFMIDRSLVVTMKKNPTKKHPNLALTGPFLFRMLLAFIISLMLSSPLELFIFEGYLKTAKLDFEKEQARIHVEEQQMEMNQIDTLDAGLRGSMGRNESRISKLENELLINNNKIVALRQKLNHPTSQRYLVAKSAINTKRSTLNSARRGGVLADTTRLKNEIRTHQGVINEEIRSWNNIINGQIAEIEEEINIKRTEITRLNEQNNKTQEYLDSNYVKREQIRRVRETKKTKYENEQTNASRFFRDYRALHRTLFQTENGHLKNPTEMLFYFLIWTIFFLIELLPTMVKVITPIGAYDYLAYHEEMALKEYFNSLDYYEKVKQKKDALIQHHVELEQEQNNIEKSTRRDILEIMSRAQIEVAEAYSNKWKNDALHNINSSSTGDSKDTTLDNNDFQPSLSEIPTNDDFD